jgi:nucleoside-diphosphate-sugar epimerase
LNNPPSLPQPVLVTGGAGFIGRHLVNRLLDFDNDVRVFDLPGVSLPEAWNGRVRLIEGDIADPVDVHRAMQGIGTVFHAAAVVSDWAPAALYERVTIDGSRHLFEEATRNGTRVMLLSSGAVYGKHVGREPVLHEDLPFIEPMGIYGYYKQRQETMAWQFHRERGMALSVVRPFKVYGPASGPWLHEVAKALLSGKPVLINGGNINMALIYVENLADILILAASLPQAQGRVYNGNDGSTITMRRYLTDLAEIIGAPEPRVMPGWAAQAIAHALPPIWRILGLRSRPLMTPDSVKILMTDYNISAERVRTELGYTARVSYEESLKRIEAYWHTQRG